jgi:leucyl/phenylalanyl-tRNA--protein transferase
VIIPPHVLLSAYATGLFPMGTPKGELEWFSPDPRGILPLDTFHVPARLARAVRQGRFEIRVDTAWDEVIDACAALDDSWITPLIRASYTRLFELGFAHSVEAWQDGALAGGLYGVTLRGVFFGESMFHRVTDASKVALVALVDRLRRQNYRLLDTQWVTTHLARFGAIEIPRDQYLRLVDAALRVECVFNPDVPSSPVHD